MRSRAFPDINIIRLGNGCPMATACSDEPPGRITHERRGEPVRWRVEYP